MALFPIGMRELKKKLPTRWLANQMTISILHLNLVPTQPFLLAPTNLQYFEGSKWKNSESFQETVLMAETWAHRQIQIVALGDEANPYLLGLVVCALAADVTVTKIDTIYIYILYILLIQEDMRTFQIFGLWSGAQGCLALWSPSGYPLHSSLLSVYSLLMSLRHTFI